MSFPVLPSPFTPPSGTQPTFSEGSFPFCLKGNLPKETVLFTPSTSGPGPLTFLVSTLLPFRTPASLKTIPSNYTPLVAISTVLFATPPSC